MNKTSILQASAKLPDRPEFAYKPKRSALFATTVILLLAIGATATYGAYKQQHNKVGMLKSQNAALASQIQAIQRQAAALAVQNSGETSFSVVPVSKMVSLNNDAVNLAISAGWARGTSERLNKICRGMDIDSDALCYDTAVVVPTKFNNDQDFYAYSGAQVSVYQRKDSESAKDWYEGVLGGYSASANSYPYVKVLANSQVNGYDAYAVEVVANDPKTSPDHYTNLYYTVVHGNYAVVVSSNLIYRDDTGVVRDYSSYLADIQTIVSTIKF